MKKHWTSYAQHIIDNINHLKGIEPAKMEEDYVVYNGALHLMQTLAESTQALPTALKERHPHIRWRDIADFRNYVAHGYLGELNPEIVKAAMENHLEPLRIAVQEMLDHRSEYEDDPKSKKPRRDTAT